MIPDPDFNQTVWFRIENKLGRKLSPTENQGIYQKSGMFKEWFFNSLDTTPIEEVERIVDHCASYVYGWANNPDHPERKGQISPYTKARIAEARARESMPVEIIKKSLWERILGKLLG